jgi:hypothetical protein
MQPAAVPPIDWAAIAGTAPLAIPAATPASPMALPLPSGWCSITCTPCPCSGALNICQRFRCTGGN